MAILFAASLSPVASTVIRLANAFGKVDVQEGVCLSDFYMEVDGDDLEFFQVGRNATCNYYLGVHQDGRVFRAELCMDNYYGWEPKSDQLCSYILAFQETAKITDLGNSPEFGFSGTYIGHH